MMNLWDQRGRKKEVLFTTRRTARRSGRGGREVRIFRALTWRRRTPTATAEKTMSAADVKTASERLRQRSASSPASSRASGGARVRARVEERIMTMVRRVFIGTGMAQRYYTGAPGDSHLRNTWQSCSMFEVVPCPTHAWIVGWSFPLLRVSGEGMSIENGQF